jgi:SAM-dependent methyltransferase
MAGPSPSSPASGAAPSGASERARDAYRDERGRDYYRTLDADEFAADVIARERARKIQPLVRETDRVLEYGVGCGYNLRHLRCAERWGYDLNDAGRGACEAAGVRFAGSLDELGDEPFDAIVCHHVLEHVPDPLDTIATMQRRLRDGGRLLVFVPFETRRRYRTFVAEDPNHHLYSWNVQSLGNLLGLTGLRLDHLAVRPFSYERRLAFLARGGMGLYHLGLRALRWMRAEDEIVAILTRPDAGGAAGDGDARLALAA